MRSNLDVDPSFRVDVAILEGVALLAIVVFLITGQQELLGIAGVPMVVIFALFPTSGRWRRFVGQPLATSH